MKNITLISLCLLLQSCLYMSIKQDTKFDESKVWPVKFESKEASELFFTKIKIIDIKNYRGSYMKEDSLMIPFVAFKNHKTFYETEYNNSKIKEADTNSDGIITFKEAQNLKYERAGLVKHSVTLVVKEN